MDKGRVRIVRLNKQEISLKNDPLESAFVIRKDELKFYFCLYKLEDDFKNGFYFGLLQLHREYPFFAPKLFMYTPNGRYEQNLPICTSFTNYHQESWTSAWNVRTLIQATISFMYANEPSYGCRADPPQMRKKYARDSLSWNMENQLFRQLFGETIKSKLGDLVKFGIHIYEKNLFLELKKLGLEQANDQNLGQIIQKPPINVYHHPINDQLAPLNNLNLPLINDPQEIQIDRELNHMGFEHYEEIQRQNRRLIEEQHRRKREKTKKIIKIIGTIAIATAVGVFIYFSWVRTAPQTSTSQRNLNENMKSGGGLINLIFQIPNNLRSLISIFKKNNNQKVLVQNN